MKSRKDWLVNGMEKNIDREQSDQLFEALLNVAAKELMSDEVNKLPNLEELNKVYLPSKSLDKKIRSIIDKEYRTYKRKRIMRKCGMIAACFGAVITASTILLMSVEATRNFIVNTFITPQHDHVAFEFGENGVSENGADIALGYLPEGFELVNSQMLDNVTIVFYSNRYGDQIIVQQHIASTLSIFIDNEFREFSLISLNNQNAYLFESHDEGYFNVIMWQHKNDVFNVFSNLNVEELVRIAENITAS